MGILFGGGRQERSWIPERPIPPFLNAPTGGMQASSVHTNPDLALAVSAVYGCVRLMCDTAAMLPLEAYRKTDGIPVKLAKQPDVLVNPYGDMTQSQWLHQVMYSLTLRGNLFGRIIDRDGFGFAHQVQPLNPDAVVAEFNDDGTVKWNLDGPMGRKPIPAVDMFHVPGLTPTGATLGLSPIAAAANTLDLSRAAQKFAGDYLMGGGIPKAVVTTDQIVDAPQARSIKDKVLAATRNREPLVIGDGLTYTQIQIKPNEAQFLETIAANDTQIARFFGVPPAMIGAPEGSNMTYSNREQRALDFLTFGVGFWLKRIEDSVSTLLPKQQFVKFDLSVLLRTDIETQATVHGQYVAMHAVAPSEIRSERGMPPMTPAQKEESDLVALEVTPQGKAKAIPGIVQVPNDPNLPMGETAPKQPTPKA